MPVTNPFAENAADPLPSKCRIGADALWHVDGLFTSKECKYVTSGGEIDSTIIEKRLRSLLDQFNEEAIRPYGQEFEQGKLSGKICMPHIRRTSPTADPEWRRDLTCEDLTCSYTIVIYLTPGGGTRLLRPKHTLSRGMTLREENFDTSRPITVEGKVGDAIIFDQRLVFDTYTNVEDHLSLWSRLERIAHPIVAQSIIRNMTNAMYAEYRSKPSSDLNERIISLRLHA